MPFTRNWTFEHQSHNPVRINELTYSWRFIPDDKIKKIIAADEQFLIYHRFLKQELRSDSNNPLYPKAELNLSLRAGMVRTEVFFLGGIAEAALFSHAIKSNLPGVKKKSTLGPIIDAWEKHGLCHIQEIREELEELRLARNTIHLTAASQQASDAEKPFWETVIRNEERLSAIGDKVSAYLKLFKNPGNLG